MDRIRDLRRGRGAHALALRAVLTTVKVAALAVLLVGPAGAVVQSATPGTGSSDTGCAKRALDQDRPARALIRTEQGRVRQVSFDVAWDVYNGRRPGTVLAVCLDDSARLTG
jgi:hypothetical protein